MTATSTTRPLSKLKRSVLLAGNVQQLKRLLLLFKRLIESYLSILWL